MPESSQSSLRDKLTKIRNHTQSRELEKSESAHKSKYQHNASIAQFEIVDSVKVGSSISFMPADL